MADNFTANAGAGGDTFAADDIGGIKYPRSKITLGADGANDGDVSSANPLPVTATALTSLDNKMPTVGQKAMASSSPVVLASDQSSIPVAGTIADGSNVAIGATTDAAVTTNTTGTLSGKLRGLVAILAAVWDSTNNWLKVRQPNNAVTQTLNSVTAGTAISCDGMNTIFIQCTVTATNTTTPQFSQDGGVTWTTATIYPLSANGIPTGAGVTTITATGRWAVPVGGWKQFRLNMTAWTSNQNVYFAEATAAQLFMIPLQPTAANLNVTLSTNTVTATQGAAATATVTAPWGSTPTQGTTLLTTTATSGATTTQTLTATGAASTRVIVRGIYVYGSSAGATCTMVLQDGGVTKIDFGTITLTANAAQYGVGVPVYTGATAANVTLVLGAASAGTTTASLVCDRE